MTRGELWWVDFGLAYGSMPQGRRPAIIVQNDNFNASHVLTTVVVPLTTNVILAEYKDNVFLDKSVTNLSKDSVALIPQVGIIDKSCLVEKETKLSPSIMHEISKALVDLLDL